MIVFCFIVQLFLFLTGISENEVEAEKKKGGGGGDLAVWRELASSSQINMRRGGEEYSTHEAPDVQ